MRILVRVRTGARESRILGTQGDVLIVELRARPERGEANRELIRLLRREYGGEVRILRGHRSRTKLVEIG
ncbi:MAG: hypothetical protein DRN14_04770 [Thermoplasmata archaeon]|nr:DUF167 domain-containing protein [Thermoplasmata archaeon]RLF27949.1 MAG: hypothetical protein DRN14_04770 [Thermoplasmata archaeon]HDJ27245.1 DUF167 domain-containing protein [Aciduliprofundum sp.]